MYSLRTKTHHVFSFFSPSFFFFLFLLMHTVKISAHSSLYHVEIVAGGTGYVNGNTIVVSGSGLPTNFGSLAAVTLTFTDGNADGIIQAGELVASAVPANYFQGPVSWTTGQMPAPMICAPERCSWDEVGKQITGAVSATQMPSCGYGTKGLDNCGYQSQGNPWSPTSTPPGLCPASQAPAKYCTQKASSERMCSAGKCAYGVFTPGASCFVVQNCAADFTGTCPAGSSVPTSPSKECYGPSCTM